MSKLEILFTLLFALIGLSSFAQSPLIYLEFKLEGQVVNLGNDFQIKFVTGQDTVETMVQDGGFIIPAELVGKKAAILFHIQKYQFDFKDLALVWNPDLPKWYIGIDTKMLAVVFYFSLTKNECFGMANFCIP